jgi:serine phosphatase RsbU (regulator of sigma subunit)
MTIPIDSAGESPEILADHYLRQQRDLAESLKYASYIQHALFPTPEEITTLLPESFVFFRPRDMVSGDFYHISGKNEYVYLAVGDCTGHGVPGAFMSILGITFLKEIISRGRFNRSSSVLNQMREYVMKALNQTGIQTEQKDGIDLTLCSVNFSENTLDFAGAFNPVYIVRDRNLTEIPGDKMPVGIGAEEEKPFTSHIYPLKDMDMIYLFSDGFSDQFGGTDGKKFKYRQFRSLLIEISPLPVSEQKFQLGQTFDAWKGNLRQLDDVLVVGFRYHPPARK